MKIRKMIKNVYQIVAVVAFVAGSLLSYVGAETQDAPGLVIIGTFASFCGALVLYGIGEIVYDLKSKNKK